MVCWFGLTTRNIQWDTDIGVGLISKDDPETCYNIFLYATEGKNPPPLVLQRYNFRRELGRHYNDDEFYIYREILAYMVVLCHHVSSPLVLSWIYCRLNHHGSAFILICFKRKNVIQSYASQIYKKSKFRNQNIRNRIHLLSQKFNMSRSQARNFFSKTM